MNSQGKNASGTLDMNALVHTVTTTSFIHQMYKGFYVGWVALGKQLQWGYGEDGSGGKFCDNTTYFPIAFPNSCLALIGLSFVISGAGRMKITTLTSTYFSLGSDLRTCGSGGWIAFGK